MGARACAGVRVHACGEMAHAGTTTYYAHDGVWVHGAVIVPHLTPAALGAVKRQVSRGLKWHRLAPDRMYFTAV